MKTLAECKQMVLDAEAAELAEADAAALERSKADEAYLEQAKAMLPEELRGDIELGYETVGYRYRPGAIVSIDGHDVLIIAPSDAGQKALARYRDLRGINCDLDADIGERYFVSAPFSDWTSDIEMAIGKAAVVAEKWDRLQSEVDRRNSAELRKYEDDELLRKETEDMRRRLEVLVEDNIAGALDNDSADDLSGVALACIAYELRQLRKLFDKAGKQVSL